MDSPPPPPQSWSAWLRARAARFLLFARSQTRGEADAQDLLQETLVELWRRAGGHPPDDALVYRTLRRRAVDLARRVDRRARREQNATPPDWWQPNPAADPTGEDDAELVRAVQTLPDPLREVVLLKIWGGLTFRQVADTLGQPLPTVAARYRRALDQLRGQLKEVRP